MLGALTILLVYQLIGEVIVQFTRLPVPGPVIGLLLLFLTLWARGSLAAPLRDTANGILQHLSLLFVPAGVGVMVHFARVSGEWLPIVEQRAETLAQVLDVNVKGVVYGMKHAGRAMARQGSGTIVNVASVQGFRVVYAGAAFYAASKAAVVQLTKSGALELGPHGVRVVGIAPGPIDTPMLRSAATEWPPAIQKSVPLDRIGEPDDIARAIVWLASPAASYISGPTLPVDGGFLAP